MEIVQQWTRIIRTTLKTETLMETIIVVAAGALLLALVAGITIYLYLTA